MKNKIKKIPYGTTDFKLIQEENYYYIDKTKYIEIIENSPRYLFLIRPRRFGKSLFLSILESYYDIFYKDNFETVFKNTYIGKNPTGEQSKYLFISFNFAIVDPKIENTEESFEFHIKNEIDYCIDKYENSFTKKQLQELEIVKKPILKLTLLLRVAKRNNLKIYVIIDEYDNFTNSILARYGNQNYESVTSEKGFFKHFFNVIKAGTTGTNAAISKLFITGVSPITLDDVTSGGIGHNITTVSKFNEFIGFTEQEVTTMLQYYIDAGKISTDINVILTFMKAWYNNYKFSEEAKQCLFNSTMVLNFIVRFMQDDRFPVQLLDDNTKIDYYKLKHLLIIDKKLNGNFSILREIIENKIIIASIKGSFSIKELSKRDNFISLLFYFGLITIKDFKEKRYILEIPNQAIKEFFANYIKEGYEDADIFKLDIYKYSNLMTDMAYRGKWKEVFLFLSKAVKEQSKIRDYIQGEAMVKGFLLAYLNITNNYIITSEKELNKGIVDLWIEPIITTHAHANYSYLVELKYNKRTKEKEMTAKIPELVAEAVTQLNQYEKDPIIIKEKSTTTVKKLVLVYNAWELIHMEEIIS